MAKALFYPWIDIKDETWLKTSLLYWDSIQTIVPESIESPYSTETAQALKAANFLIPLRVQSSMHEIEELTSDVLTYLNTSEGAELLLARRGSLRHPIHLEKLPRQLGRLVRMHPEKLPSEIRYLLEGVYTGRDEWAMVDDGFANFYMTLLATRLAERNGAGLLTSLPSADRLAGAARLDAQINGLIPWRIAGVDRDWREYEAFGRRHYMRHELSPGMLAHLSIERIGIMPDTPIDRLIAFKEEYRDELALFRTKIEQLTTPISTDLPVEALRQRITDIYQGEVEPAINNLKKALKGRRIRSTAEGILKVAFLSAGPTSLLIHSGMDIPTALLAGAGISLIVQQTLYNMDKEESLRTNPYAYLLSAERELGHEK